MRQFGLIGRKLGHSFSAKYFGEKFKREGLDLECAYSLYELSTIEQVEELVASTPSLVGFNVTIPYKQQIIPYLDAVSDEARGIGAVNCVKILADGHRIGYNTDVVGIRSSLDSLMGGADVGQALVLGTGGASRAVQYVLAERSIDCKVVSREKSKGDITYDELTPDVVASHTLIINASPVGMYPNVEQAPDIDYNSLSENHFLFDLVYNPEVTRFMELGAAQGAQTLSGLDMLYAQAEAAWRIWNE